MSKKSNNEYPFYVALKAAYESPRWNSVNSLPFVLKKDGDDSIHTINYNLKHLFDCLVQHSIVSCVVLATQFVFLYQLVFNANIVDLGASLQNYQFGIQIALFLLLSYFVFNAHATISNMLFALICNLPWEYQDYDILVDTTSIHPETDTVDEETTNNEQ